MFYEVINVFIVLSIFHGRFDDWTLYPKLKASVAIPTALTIASRGVFFSLNSLQLSIITRKARVCNPGQA